jgi:hypothetical protein
MGTSLKVYCKFKIRGRGKASEIREQLSVESGT